MRAQEKAAGVLPTPTTASKLLNTRSVSAAARVCNISAKAYTTLQAEFALMGRELVRVHRAHDGRISYTVHHRGESLHLGTVHDVRGHLAALRCLARG